MRARLGWTVAVTAALCLPLVLPSTASAADQAPRVGECYDLSDDVLRAGGWWPSAEPVPCTEPHTFEVTQTGLLPEDADAFDVAAERCTALAVWSAVGVNRAVAGIVTDPLRIEPWSFGVRGRPGSWLCGAVAMDYNGRAEPTAVRLDSPLDGLTRRAAAALRHCASAADGRGASAPPITVPCSTRPRWQARTWVLWTAFYDDDPGRAELRARAEELCGPRTVPTVPSAADWAAGLPLTACHRKYP